MNILSNTSQKSTNTDADALSINPVGPFLYVENYLNNGLLLLRVIVTGRKKVEEKKKIELKILKKGIVRTSNLKIIKRNASPTILK